MEYKIAIAKQLSDILKSKRKSLGLTQTDMGQKLGVSQRVFARNETSPEKVHFERILQICSELDMDLIIRERNRDENKAALPDVESW